MKCLFSILAMFYSNHQRNATPHLLLSPLPQSPSLLLPPNQKVPPPLTQVNTGALLCRLSLSLNTWFFFMSWFSKELLKLWFICIVSICYKNFLCTSLYLIKDKLFCTFHFLIYIYSYHKWLLSFSAILLLQYSYIYIYYTYNMYCSIDDPKIKQLFYLDCPSRSLEF